MGMVICGRFGRVIQFVMQSFWDFVGTPTSQPLQVLLHYEAFVCTVCFNRSTAMQTFNSADWVSEKISSKRTAKTLSRNVQMLTSLVPTPPTVEIKSSSTKKCSGLRRMARKHFLAVYESNLYLFSLKTASAEGKQKQKKKSAIIYQTRFD